MKHISLLSGGFYFRSFTLSWLVLVS